MRPQLFSRLHFRSSSLLHFRFSPFNSPHASAFACPQARFSSRFVLLTIALLLRLCIDMYIHSIHICIFIHICIYIYEYICSILLTLSSPLHPSLRLGPLSKDFSTCIQDLRLRSLQVDLLTFVCPQHSASASLLLTLLRLVRFISPWRISSRFHISSRWLCGFSQLRFLSLLSQWECIHSFECKNMYIQSIEKTTLPMSLPSAILLLRACDAPSWAVKACWSTVPVL